MVKDAESYTSGLYGGECIDVPITLIEVLSDEHELSQEVISDFTPISTDEIDLLLYQQTENDIDF